MRIKGGGGQRDSETERQDRQKERERERHCGLANSSVLCLCRLVISFTVGVGRKCISKVPMKEGLCHWEGKPASVFVHSVNARLTTDICWRLVCLENRGRI